MQLVRNFEKKSGKKIGIYPELKHPSYFQSIGISLADKLLAELSVEGFTPKQDPIYIQCFEPSTLQAIAKQAKDWQLIQLLSANDDVSDKRLREIKSYAAGIGPDKRMILPISKNGGFEPATNLIARAHAFGLKVHPYTFRSDGDFLNPEYKGNPAREYSEFFRLGVDGLFSDFPEHALTTRKKYFSL